MTPIYGCDADVAAWVAARIPLCARGFGDCKAIGVGHGGKLVAGVVYHNWSPEWGLIEMSAAADDRRWMTRRVVNDLLAYPFGFCRAVMAQTDETGPARSIWQRLGAAETTIPDMRGEGEANIVFILSKTTWQAGRFCMENRHG